jgi:hypothetical protein
MKAGGAAMTQEKTLFRKESLDRISSPEQLNDYLKVTDAPAWIVLLSVIVLVAGLVIWSALGTVETSLTAEATVQDGVAVVMVNADKATLEAGMEIRIGTSSAFLDAAVTDIYGRCRASARMDIPDGTYPAEIVTGSHTPMSLLF